MSEKQDFRAELVGLMTAVSGVMDRFKHTDQGLALSEAFCQAERALADDAAAARCSGCEHGPHRAGRCWAAIGITADGGDAMCPCKIGSTS